MGFDLAKPYQFESDHELIEFLANHNIQAVPSSEAHPGCLHWWEDEKFERLFDVALLQGELFLAVTDKSLELYVLDPNNCWFDLVKVWDRHFSKETFATELKRLMSGDGKDLWLYVRKTVVDRDLKRMLNEIGIEQILPDLKRRLLEFHEGLVYFPWKRDEFKQAMIDLLTLLARDNIRTPDNCLFIQRYFLNLTIVIENLPQKFRAVMHQIEQSFENGQIPNREMIDSLIKKAEVL